MKKTYLKSLVLSPVILMITLAGCTATGTVTPVPSGSVTPTVSPTISASPTTEPTISPTTTPTTSPVPTMSPTPSPSPTSIGARSIFAIDNNNNLYRFSSSSPSAIGSTVVISGLQLLERIVGIDFRPADNKLYGVGTSNRVYIIDTTTGNATQVAGPFTPALNGISFGFDFNPVADKIRLHSDMDQDLRINPVTGGVAASDPSLSYADSDTNAGANPNIAGTAYTNSLSGATSTDLYAIDSDRDILVKLMSPDTGKISTVGPLGINTNDYVGFDIDGATGLAYAALNTGIGGSALYSINLSSGAATLVENIGTANPIRGIAIQP